MYLLSYDALSLGLTLAALGVSALPSRSPSSITAQGQRSRYVPFDQLHTCPRLSPRDPPRSAKDVRPDDFTVVMALGDSITAGLLARGSRDDTNSRYDRQRQRSASRTETSSQSHAYKPASHELPSPLDGLSTGDDRTQKPLGEVGAEEWWHPHLVPEVAEWRGLSYSIGMDEGAITLPNIMGHFARLQSRNVTGGSSGHHPPLTCLGDIRELGRGGRRGKCWPHTEEDGLNAAVSGSVSEGLMSQVRDYLIPTIKELGIKDEEWKYVNLGIGANDVCAFCLSPNLTDFRLLGSPQQFAANIREAVNELRRHVPNIIVNIIGMFEVSAIYKLTLKDPYCQPPLLPLPVPHLALECSCALLPGPGGDYTRSKMDEMGQAYDAAVLEVVREWDEEEDPAFGVLWQPGTSVDLANYPISALSPIDCFHPSEAAHQRVAVGFWNRLTMRLEDKYTPIPWDETPLIRCLEEGDSVRVGSVSRSWQI